MAQNLKNFSLSFTLIKYCLQINLAIEKINQLKKWKRRKSNIGTYEISKEYTLKCLLISK